MKTSRLARTIRALLLSGAMLGATTAHAADPTGATIYTRAQIQEAGYTDLAEFLQDLPEHGTGKTLRFGGPSLEGDIVVDLRRAGLAGTVLLVDGQRWLAGLSGSFDLSALPLALVDRVELSHGGIGPTAGTRGLGSTINVITRQGFDGADAGATFGQFDEGDGERTTADFAIGATSERAAVSLIAAYSDYEGLLAGDRDISVPLVAGLPSDRLSGGASTTTPFGRFGFGSGGGRLPNGSSGTLTLIPGRAGTASSDFRLFNPEGDAYNFQPFVSLLMPSERTQVATLARYALTDDITAHFGAFYAERRSEQRLGAPLLTTGTVATGAARVPIPATQAYNPFGVPVTRAQFRLVGLDRDFEQDVDTLRFNAGLDGHFDWGDRAVAWRVGAIRADIESHQIGTGVLDTGAILNALGPSFQDAGGVWRCGTSTAVIAGCVPLNIFGGPVGLSAEMLDYVSTLSQQSEEIEQWQYYAGARAEVFELPAGAMTLDVSYLHRDEQGFVIPDAFIASGGSPTTGNVPAKSEFSVDAFGAVLDVPLLADAPWARALGVRASADLSRFDNDHEAFSPGLTLHWDVNDEWSVSLANDHGLREPSVVELGSEVRQFQIGPIDPCTVEGRPMGDVLARCRAGFGGTVPTPVGLATAGGIVFVTIGGNADLAPERSRLREWNIHYRPEWGRGLTVDLTWYEQDLRRQIGIVSGKELLDRCYVRGQAPSCVGIVREASGTLLTIDTGFYNAPWRTHVEGYELHAAHSLEAPFGTLTFDFLAHYLARLEREGVDQGPIPFTSIGERNGSDGAIHRLRANLGATWERGDYAVTLGARYYSAVDGACLPGLDATPGADFARVCDDPERAIYQGDYLAPSPADRAGSTWFTDAQIRWNAPWHAQLSLTVRNLLDQDPPTVYDGAEGNFDPQYPVPGRFWFIAYRQAF